MAEFEPAIEITLAHEGGYVNDPDDPGGETNWGISKRFMNGIGDDRDLATLTRDEAVKLYREHFWVAYGYGRFESQEVANKTFDSCVNMGPRAAHKILQRAIRANGRPIKDDGILGPQSLYALNSCMASQVLLSMKSEMAAWYRVLIARQPVRKKYERGWLRRAYEDSL